MSNYICRLNENVKREHVRYYNRYGIALAGDLYTAKAMDQKQKHMAVIVGAPYGGVKEQGPCLLYTSVHRLHASEACTSQ